MHTVVPGIWQETLKNEKNETHTLQDLEYDRKTEKGRTLEMHTTVRGIWREILKTRKMRNTRQAKEYGEKTEKPAK